MNTLGINGSPRRGGNSEFLLDRMLDFARARETTVRKLILNDLSFRPCQECGGCNHTGECVIDDDMKAVYKYVEEADSIIVASPIFFGSVSAQIKIMIDRFQCSWVGKYKLKQKKSERDKKGVFVSVSAGDRQDFFDNAKSVIKNFFAVENIKYAGDIFCPYAEDKGSVLSQTECLRRAQELAKKLIDG